MHRDALAPSWAAARPLGFLEGVKKEMALRLWHEKSLVLHKPCTLRCFARLPKFPPPAEFQMEVKLSLAVESGGRIILHRNIFFSNGLFD